MDWIIEVGEWKAATCPGSRILEIYEDRILIMDPNNKAVFVPIDLDERGKLTDETQRALLLSCLFYPAKHYWDVSEEISETMYDIEQMIYEIGQTPPSENSAVHLERIGRTPYINEYWKPSDRYRALLEQVNEVKAA